MILGFCVLAEYGPLGHIYHHYNSLTIFLSSYASFYELVFGKLEISGYQPPVNQYYEDSFSYLSLHSREFRSDSTLKLWLVFVLVQAFNKLLKLMPSPYCSMADSARHPFVRWGCSIHQDFYLSMYLIRLFLLFWQCAKIQSVQIQI